MPGPTCPQSQRAVTTPSITRFRLPRPHRDSPGAGAVAGGVRARRRPGRLWPLRRLHEAFGCLAHGPRCRRSTDRPEVRRGGSCCISLGVGSCDEEHCVFEGSPKAVRAWATMGTNMDQHPQGKASPVEGPNSNSGSVGMLPETRRSRPELKQAVTLSCRERRPPFGCRRFFVQIAQCDVGTRAPRSRLTWAILSRTG